jgi:hypothetical protein
MTNSPWLYHYAGPDPTKHTSQTGERFAFYYLLPSHDALKTKNSKTSKTTSAEEE